MRAGLSTIQQTLTPEAASVLNHSIAEATRRNHGQTTPLHVAATLLASPTGYLRQACIKSHPNSSHPLQCRALELCFSVALERLPTAQNSGPGIDPPISNALMAALKRAQAHQRRGCPEQQQQPLLAVKVELEQLIISILDDPSVSRVMREASFSSPAVKATIEQSLNSTNTNSSISGPIGLGFRPVPASPNRNPYLNPRLQQSAATVQQSGQPRGEVVQRVIGIMLGGRKKNVVLVGESEPERVVKEVLRKIESKEIGDGLLRNVEVIRLNEEPGWDKDQIVAKIKELGSLVEARIAKLQGGGVILDLGDLKWLVEQQAGFGAVGGLLQQQVVPEGGRAAVAEMARLLTRFGDGVGGRVWLIGTATCETYLRCQVYHPSMENDWDLQAVPIASRTPLQGLFPRIGQNGLLGCSAESMSPLTGLSMASCQQRCLTDNFNQSRKASGLCPQCLRNYEQELARMGACKEFEKSSDKLESTKSTLPQWLQGAKVQDSSVKTTDQLKDEELIWKQKSSALQKKWNDMCLHLHPHFHQTNPGSERFASNALSMTSLCAPNMLTSQTMQPRLQQCRSIVDTIPINPKLMNPILMSSRPAEPASTPPGSPVRTDLVLGRPKVTVPEPTPKELVRDFFNCTTPSGPQKKLQDIPTGKRLDAADSFKKFLKSLVEKVWWQHDAASAVATTVAQCRLGNGRRRAAGSKGDIWLLFMGPDRAGKKKMASALSELVCGAHPVSISLGTRRNDEEPDPGIRGKTVVDRIAEAVRRNPLSVIMLEDMDEADLLVQGSIKRAMERGRLADAHGREISLGNVIFILTTNWLPDNLKVTSHGNVLDDKKLASLASRRWQLRLSLCERSAKRRASWLHDEDRITKPRKETTCSGLSFDLNEAADVDEDKGDGSHNSSDLTVDHEEERERCCPTDKFLSSPFSSASHELLSSVDDAIAFKPVDFGPIKRQLANAVTRRFSAIVGDSLLIEIPDEALEKITSGVWIGQTGMEEWLEKVLVPSFHQLKPRLAALSDESLVARLEIETESDDGCGGEWLPERIQVTVDGF